MATAAILQGTIYNAELEPEPGVLVEINSTPAQRFLSRDGRYSLEAPAGEYLLTAQKEEIVVSEPVRLPAEGTFVYDLFLIPEFSEEDDLWRLTEEELVDAGADSFPWQYIVAAVILLLLGYRFYRARKKYGPLWKFRKRMKEEAAKTSEQHKEELAGEPGYIEKAVEIIKRHDGRITQKELRKEMLYLSEAKISLLLTELEHKGRIEKIKKGRGNVVILR